MLRCSCPRLVRDLNYSRWHRITVGPVQAFDIIEAERLGHWTKSHSTHAGKAVILGWDRASGH